MTTVIFGLGNPGAQYDNTRHNFGRMCIQKFADLNNLQWKKFNDHGDYIKYEVNGDTLYLLKTTTLFMNQSGIYLREFTSFYKIPPANCIIVYDEMDYPVGTFKLRMGGSAAGHNGMKDIFSNLGTQDIKRIRLGIGRPANNKVDFVIGKFSSSEMVKVNKVVDKVASQVIPEFLKIKNFDLLMNKFNI